MNDTLDVFTTDSAPGEEEFEQMTSEAFEQYKDYLFGSGQYCGSAMIGSLQYGIRVALASGRLSPTTLYGQFEEPALDREIPTADDLRAAVDGCSVDQRQEMLEKAQEVGDDGR